ncbi:MAG: iron-sulfur cluster-binding oxidoreductase [Geobacteraceae bacterium]|nr:iron-sulfur cluster-binding oxidoreductase [Geobacteraceae bacterium]
MGNLGCGCPGSMAKVIERTETTDTAQGKAPSELRQWPVQLHLVPPTAPYFQDADILICADCVAFAMGSMHQDLLKGKALAIACPKLDDTTAYVDKLAHIFSANRIKSISVAIMEVPCCRGLDIMVREALQKSGKDIPLESITIGINGERRN